MDGKGAWRDNVFVERLWRSVRYEEVYLRAYDSVSEARASIGRYFDFYNGRRPHASLDGNTARSSLLQPAAHPHGSLTPRRELHLAMRKICSENRDHSLPPECPAAARMHPSNTETTSAGDRAASAHTGFRTSGQVWSDVRRHMAAGLTRSHALRVDRQADHTGRRESSGQNTHAMHGEELKRHFGVGQRHKRDYDLLGGAQRASLMGSTQHTVTGRAAIDISLNGFPRGTVSKSRTDGELFREVKLNRGRAMPPASMDG